MSVKMSKQKAVLFAITVFFSSFIVMWQMYIIIIANDLYSIFPNQTGVVTAMLGWPAIVVAISSLLAGWLMKKTTSKVELIIAAVLVGVFGVVAPIGSNAVWILICCFGQAIACGFANTAGAAIIAEVFIDENKRARMMGFYNGIMSGLGALMGFVGGLMALSGWQTGFSMFWAALPLLIMNIFFLPNIKPSDREGAEVAEAGTATGPKEKLGARYWWFFTSQFLYNVAYAFFLSFISLYVSENELGDVAFTGTMATLNTAAAFVAGLAFGFIFGKLLRKMNYINYVVPILILVWMWLAPSTLAVIIGVMVYGFCYGGAISLLYTYSASCVPMSRVGFVMGLATFCYGIALWLGVYVVNWLMGINGGTITATYPVAAGIILVATIIELIWFRKDDKEGFLEVADEAV